MSGRRPLRLRDTLTVLWADDRARVQVMPFVAPQDAELGQMQAVQYGRPALIDAAAGAYVVSLLDGFPDATMTVRDQFGSGPWVVHEFTFQGTHASPVEGPDGTIATTGRRVTGSGVLSRIELASSPSR